ncbi:MAG: hypothetical protein JO210_19595 [Acidobacteriaceae bacterium]|nr:hypothetical protein [Acidobacteriaceae bacterium]
MVTIASYDNLTIGTGEGANLADGLPLFPSIGTARAGISNTNRSESLLDFELTILFSRTKFHSFYTYLMGVLGPAIAFDLPANVTLNNLDNGQGEIDADLQSNQNVVAGFGFGLAAGAGFSLFQQFYLPEKWYSPWKFAWKTALDLNVQVNVDVIQLLLYLIQALIGIGNYFKKIEGATADKFNKYLVKGTTAAQAFSFWGNGHGFGPNETSTATAKFVLPIDLFSLVPALKEFNRTIGRITGNVEFGTQFTVSMPVTLSLDSFEVTGGQGTGSIAKYGPITYNNSTAKAKGQAFSTGSKPQRFTTNVSYSTSFTIALGFFLHVTICKVFDEAITTRSLDLLELMHLPRPGTGKITGSVITDLNNRCVLLPQMTMSFVSNPQSQYHLPANTVVTDIKFQGLISLTQAWQGPPASIAIETNPQIEGFPQSAIINTGATTASFAYTFPNDRIPTGDPNNPGSTVSPSATSPYATYLVRASLPPDPDHPCVDWEVTVPVMVQNRTLQTGFQAGTQAVGPPYNADGGAELNADQSKEPGKAVASFVTAKYEFPYPPGSSAANGVEMKMYLLDADRNPHNGSDVRVTFDSGLMTNLSRPNTVKVPLGLEGNTFRLEWRSTGPETNYSSVFFLIMDAGGIYGQSEFWLHVWNWS